MIWCLYTWIKVRFTQNTSDSKFLNWYHPMLPLYTRNKWQIKKPTGAFWDTGSIWCWKSIFIVDTLYLTWNWTYATILESLGNKEVNYNHINDFDSNQDNPEDQECPPSVFCKEIGILMDFFTWNSTHATFLESLG